MITKKKKKGRPSLLDLQKRSLKKQQHHKTPNLFIDPSSYSNNDDDDERKLKKQKLLLGLNLNSNSNSLLHNNSTLFPNSNSNSDPQTAQFHPIHNGSNQNVSFDIIIPYSSLQFQIPSLNYAIVVSYFNLLLEKRFLFFLSLFLISGVSRVILFF